jgi:hypothetical protein
VCTFTVCFPRLLLLYLDKGDSSFLRSLLRIYERKQCHISEGSDADIACDSKNHFIYSFHLGDFTEHFGIYPYRKPTNASK